MKRILVATDISTNSGSALRFALQLAAQRGVTLTFMNVYNVMRPTSWSESQYVTYEQRELANRQQQLKEFVEAVQQPLGGAPAGQSYVVMNSFSVESVIMGYAEEHHFDYICIGVRGAGAIQKLIGTTAATLINQSAVPVIAVPAVYQASPIKSVLYASDLTNLESELTRVIDFARPLDATVDLLHITSPTRVMFDSAILQTTIRQFTDYQVNIHLEAPDLGKNLTENLERAIQRLQPSTLVMFTTQRSGFVERLFSTSYSAEYAFNGSIPLVVYTKK
ncbi:hypothetical protein GCM10027341_44380 [Spirosoma knui]